MSATKIWCDFAKFHCSSGSLFRHLLNFYSSNCTFYIWALTLSSFLFTCFCFIVSCSCFMVVIPSFESLNIFIVRPFLDCFYSLLSQRLILAVGFVGTSWSGCESITSGYFSQVHLVRALWEHILLTLYISGPYSGPSLPWVCRVASVLSLGTSAIVSCSCSCFPVISKVWSVMGAFSMYLVCYLEWNSNFIIYKHITDEMEAHRGGLTCSRSHT